MEHSQTIHDDKWNYPINVSYGLCKVFLVVNILKDKINVG